MTRIFYTSTSSTPCSTFFPLSPIGRRQMPLASDVYQNGEICLRLAPSNHTCTSYYIISGVNIETILTRLFGSLFESLASLSIAFGETSAKRRRQTGICLC
ncbi:hypothetical protein GYMLUDRAFT_552950 [Collybiopsis luxurians FD-317 M1]|uniref:Uncharacterized protein n=1 Tax=Collybiopsis luxurians FD-317 M1 TaxID=944289 RepID=A0A0D0BEI3_9AGAR|nr:hypothetical protein GYMLUDRAFT_552950 [Collybiopsis luxurians FD-317 M1]